MHRFQFMHHWYLWYYLAVTGLILGPLLLPGYVITFDMAWTPHVAAPAFGNDNGAIVAWLLHTVNAVVPSQLLQKLLLVALMLVAGVGAHRLARLQLPEPVAYVAGTFMLFNPWWYTRLMAGQYLVLAGAALLPWVLAALWRLLNRPSYRAALRLAGWSVALAWFSIHAIGLAVMASVALLVAWSWGRPRAGLTAVHLRALALAAAAWLIGNLYWLPALILGATRQAQQIASFGLAEAEAFRTVSNPGLPAPWNVAALQGFWADLTGQYVLPSATGWLFALAALALAALVAMGLWRSVRRRDRLGLALAVVGLISWFLAVGLAWPPSAAVTTWLINHVPYYRGYREPHKWAALAMLADSYLIAAGLAALRERLPRRHWQPVELGALLLPIGLVPMLLWGAAGQLRSVEYPASWYQLNERLVRQVPAGEPVLMLPWHLYLPLHFNNDRLSANPVPGFFDVTTVSSGNAEMPGVGNNDGPTTLAGRVSNEILARRTTSTNLGAPLLELGIHWVVLFKEADWAEYGWLSQQAGLKLEAESADWQLWVVDPAAVRQEEQP